MASTKPTWTDENRQALIRLWNQGRSAIEIGRELGMTPSMVLGKVRRLRERGHILRGASTRPSDPRDLTADGR